MDAEQREWLNQFYSNIGRKEVIRLTGAIFIWTFVGVVITVTLNIILGTIFLISMFILPFLIRWRFMYLSVRTILGNKNLPTEPMPRRNRPTIQSRKWWSYLPGIWWILIDLILLYAVIKYISK